MKQMKDAAVVNELRSTRDEAQKEQRRIAQEGIKDFNKKMSKKNQELGATKETKKAVQDAEAGKRAADAAKKAADEERAKYEERNRELSADLTRAHREGAAASGAGRGALSGCVSSARRPIRSAS